MTKVIIQSDLHLRHRHADVIASWEEPYDKAIWLGDTFDQFGDTPEQNADAARWLKEKLEDPRNVMLIGNHDFAQMYPSNPNAFCSGFTEAKSKAVRTILTQDDFVKLRPYHVDHNILFSHAGLDRDWFYYAARAGFEFPSPLTLPEIVKWLDLIWPQVVLRYEAGRFHPLMGAGHNRGGEQKIGGITWQDFSDHVPIEGVAQICGHTPQTPADGPLFRLIHKDKSPMWRRAKKGVNPQWIARGWTLCMDSHNKHYGVIEDGVLRIKSVSWMKEYDPVNVRDYYRVEPGEVICEVKLP